MKIKEPTPAIPPGINWLLYGSGGSGKTRATATLPGSLAYLNLDTPNAMVPAYRLASDRIMEIEFEGLRTLHEIGNAVMDGNLGAETLVVDPVGDLHRKLITEASSGAVRPTLNQYGDVSTHLERFCRFMCEAPINFVVVAHEATEKNEATGEVETLPFMGTGNLAPSRKLVGMMDVVAYCAPLETQEGVKYMGQLINLKGRRGKDRFAVLGDYRELDLGEWSAVIHATPDNSTTQEAVAA